jgi:hypothetical protein
MVFINHGEVAHVAGKKQTGLWFGLILCLLASLFCFLGYAQAIWLSATPNYPADRASYNVRTWGFSALAFFGAAVFFVVVLYKSARRLKDGEQR